MGRQISYRVSGLLQRLFKLLFLLRVEFGFVLVTSGLGIFKLLPHVIAYLVEVLVFRLLYINPFKLLPPSVVVFEGTLLLQVAL